MKKRDIITICLLLGCLFLVSGCTKRNQTKQPKENAQTTTEDVAQDSDMYTAVISDIRWDASQLTVKTVEDGWVYKVSYDSETECLSRYGEKIAVGQLEVGQIVDIKSDAKGQIATKIQISYDSWEYEKVSGLVYNRTDKTIGVMGEQYGYTTSLVLYDKTAEKNYDEEGPVDTSAEATEEGPKDLVGEKATTEALKEKLPEELSLSEIDPVDTVTCRGYKGKICSVVLESGHGYVRLSGDSTFIGGMIAIGKVIQPVVKGMVMTVPVGTWTLEIDKDGRMGTKNVIVSQNVEQTVNLADLAIIKAQKGVMHFIITPANASIYIDGVEYNDQTDFMLEFGVHKVQVVAVGYKAYNGEIELKSAYMNVNVSLVSLSSDGGPTASTSTSKTKSTTQASSTESTSEIEIDPGEPTTTEVPAPAATEIEVTTTEPAVG